MGTRADFYVGQGVTAEWIGSIGWDGYPDGIDAAIKNATTEREFRSAVALFFVNRDDVTLPGRGWPWPWNDSRKTDYSYLFVDGRVMASSFGHALFPALEKEPEDQSGPKVEFPDMSARKSVALDGRSGIIIIGGAP